MGRRVFREWHPDRTGFPPGDRVEQIRFLLRFAILAPSGHNAQPWRFEIDRRAPALGISLEPARVLRVSDPTDRITYMALGTAARNFVRAAEAYGLAPAVAVVEDGGAAAVRITLEDAPAGAGEPEIDWIEAITHRVSNRYAYLDEPIRPEQQRRLTDFAVPGVDVRVCTTAADKAVLAELTAVSSKSLINSKAFREELAACIHENGNEIRTGMPAANQGFPGVVAPVAPLLVRHARVGTGLAWRYRRQLNDAPMLVVLLTEGDSAGDWIRSGMAHEELFLRATAEGLAFDTYAAATGYESTRAELTRRLNLTGHPQIVLRIGRPRKANASISPCPRLGVGEVLA